MKEIKDILQAFYEAQKQGKQTVLATVVHVDGSSYRRPGARMLITEDGQLTGSISGGCLEGDALRKALLGMTQQRSMLVTYDTNDEDDAKLGMWLGCNGIIQVLIEPIDILKPNNPIELLQKASSKRQQTVLITLFSLKNKREAQYGTCLLISEEGNSTGDVPVLKEILTADAKAVLSNKSSSFKNYISESLNFTAFIELIKPAVALVIVGAGNDVIPLVDMAEILGWETTVVDGRANYAKQDRFVSSCRVLVSKPENVFKKLVIDEQTVFLLMTHNYNYDLAMLRQLLNKNVVYAGILGPRKKMERMLKELREEGISLTEQQLSVIHSPVGLDIGAETAEEIALSILAEIKAMFAGKQGQSLRSNKEVIHPRSATKIEEVKLTSKI
ncbi:MAG: XdhC family protein [Bacteroidia bacterium]|nr:XdhC family protein [Bacteroidia bacterium]